MDEAMNTRYWCHMCSQEVYPVNVAEIKCPYCQDGFLEEMDSGGRDSQEADGEIGSDRTLSLWAPILLGMMGNTRRRRRRLQFDDEDDDETDVVQSRYGGEDFEVDRAIESMIRQRRRSTDNILHLLQSIQGGVTPGLENHVPDRYRHREGNLERDRMLLINPLNQAIILQGSSGNPSYALNDNSNIVGSLGDYFIGPGLDLLLQHLAENDPNHHGTPPTRKETIEGLPTVAVKENCLCSVCLDDLEFGNEAKEMPCKHKFHSRCILPWLEMHSSCPVCRFQLPADDTKLESSDGSRSGGESGRENGVENEISTALVDGRNGGSGRRFTFPWPFAGLFSSSSASGGNSTTSSSSSNGRNGSSSANDE